MIKLTNKQSLIIDFIRSHSKLKGCLPSKAEITRHFNFNSPNSVPSHFRLLENKGYIVTEDNAVGYKLRDDAINRLKKIINETN